MNTTVSFIEAYQQARLRMDELKISVRNSSDSTVMAAMMAGKPVIVTKRVKVGSDILLPGDKLTADPNLLHRYEILARDGYFVTTEQYARSLEWKANKQKYEHLESAFKKWDDASTASQKARGRLARAEAELAAARGEVEETTARLQRAEAEGMEVFRETQNKLTLDI